MNTTIFEVGDTVRIVAGAHGGRVGKVRGFGRESISVEFQAPVLLTQPDGPTKSLTLPFGRRELVIATDLIPAGPGKRRRLTVPVPIGEDVQSTAVCTCFENVGDACPRCTPRTYTLDANGAKHRKVVAA